MTAEHRPNPNEKTDFKNFLGDIRNTTAILKFVENMGATHITITENAILFIFDDDPLDITDINRNPTNYLSLASSEVVKIVEDKINKGCHFEARSFRICPDV